MSVHIQLEELEIYRLSMDFAEDIWELVQGWGYFSKVSLGTQITRSADSMAANIAEGYGRFFYADRKKFLYYARGSLLETLTWTIKSKNRKLINDDKFYLIKNKLRVLHLKLNIYIKSIKTNIETDK